MALYPREGAWRWLGMTCLWQSWGDRGRGSPTNKFLAGVPCAQGGAGSGVRLALLMDPAVLALCPARCHLTCHVWGRGDCHPTSQMRKSAER